MTDQYGQKINTQNRQIDFMTKVLINIENS